MRAAIRFGITILMLVAVGCATSSAPDASTDAILDRIRLEERIESHAQAMFSNDYRTQYDMMAPHMREAISFAEWKRDGGVDESQVPPVSEKLVSARLAKAHHCSYYPHPAVSSPLFRCVLSVELVLIGEDGKQQTDELGQMWEHYKGEWYFGFPLH